MGTICLHDFVEAQADLRPDALAVISGDTALSYRELDGRANRLARYLRLQGAGPGKLIGIYFERSADPIIAILACLKSGAAYVPIDPAYPTERIRTILEESEALLLITEKFLSEKASASFQGLVLVLEEHAKRVAACDPNPLSKTETQVTAEDLCYVIYTSGTTGRPKGIMTEHRNVVKFVEAFNEVCKTEPGENIFQGFSLTFDGSVEEMWMAFSNGSTLLVPTRETARFGNELAQFLAQNQVVYFSTFTKIN
jgi:non-ribosomal peptide synthetase component F